MGNSRRFLAVFTGVLVTCWLGCTPPPVPEEEEHGDTHERAGSISLSAEGFETAGIAVVTVQRESRVPTIRVTGTLSYDERNLAIATARVGGRITRVIADYGQEVTRGETLAWIDSPELGAAQAAYQQADSMSKLRKAEYERAQLLLKGQAISRGELLRREAEWLVADAELHAAEQNLHILGLSQEDVSGLLDDPALRGHEYPVRAPIDGRVTDRSATQGRVVTANEELFTVARLESLWLFLQIFEKDLPAVREGTAVMLTCESHPDHRFSGSIDFVGQVLDPHSRTVQARALIRNEDGKLKPGMFVYATVEAPGTDRAVTTVLSVPKAAIARLEGSDVVFVQTAERTFEVRHVALGQAGQEWVEVREGLDEGEAIAVQGVFTLKSEVLKGGLEEHHH